MVKCPNCGGGLYFDPSRQAVVCHQCGSEFRDRQILKLQDVMIGEKQNLKGSENSKLKENEYQTMIYTCPNCGGQLISGDETAGTFCSFCGSNVLLEGRLSKEKKPDSLIPFKITKEQAEENYRKAIRKNLFIPSYMKQDSHVQEFRGIYMPYWSYSYSTEPNQDMNVKSKVSYTKGNYEYTDHYQTTSSITASQSGMSYDAVSSFSDSLSEAIAPFSEKETTEFHPAYLSGFYADIPDVSMGNYADQAADETKTYIAQSAISNPIYHETGASLEDIEKAVHVKKDYAVLKMFPVWFLASRSKKNRVSYAVVNGQTGKVAADMPISFGKYLIGSLLMSIPLFLLFNLVFSMTAHTIATATIFFSLASMILLNRDINWAYTLDQNLDDIGYLAVHDDDVTEEDQKWIETLKQNRQKEAARGPKKSSWFFPTVREYLSIYGWGILFPAILIYGFFEIDLDWMIPCTASLYLLGLIVFVIYQMGSVRGHKQIRSIKPAPMAMKKSLLKPLAGMIVCILCLFINPVRDSFYYGASIFSAVMTIWSVYDLIGQHNLHTTRRLPQFNERGGSKAFSVLLALILITGVCAGPVQAAENQEKVQYSYQLVLDDQEDLLTPDQEKELSQVMTPILAYGNVIFVTVDQYRVETSEYASSYYKQFFGSESGTLFVIDMGKRMIYIFSDGEVYRSITDSKANTITDNVYEMATDRDYFRCAKEAFIQIRMVLEGKAIAEPMRLICNGLLALLTALLLNFIIVSMNSRLNAPTDEERELNYIRSFHSSSPKKHLVKSVRKYVPPSSHSSGGSSGGGGGGSSGGGGGHSF